MGIVATLRGVLRLIQGTGLTAEDEDGATQDVNSPS